MYIMSDTIQKLKKKEPKVVELLGNTNILVQAESEVSDL